MNRRYIKTCAKLIIVPLLLLIVQIATAQVPQRIRQVVKTTNRFGNTICFYINAVCTHASDSCCGPRCVIDGNICLGDCINQAPIDSIHGATFHVEYINGGWRWGHVCNAETHECEICDCHNASGMWAYNNGLTGYQDLVSLAQYMNNCCAPAVPNPIECDSSILNISVFCTRVKRWCCNGQLMRLEFTLYPCEHQEDEIITDYFSLHYHGGPVNDHSSYDIFSDPDNPCALSDEKRRLILQAFLDSQGENPCDDTRTKSNQNQIKD